jgi:putative transposase
VHSLAEYCSRGERGIWQRRFWEHLIRDEADFARLVEYCYINPVKHALVRRVCDWPYSSFHRDVRAGLFPEDWAGEIEPSGSFGERVEGHSP